MTGRLLQRDGRRMSGRGGMMRMRMKVRLVISVLLVMTEADVGAGGRPIGGPDATSLRSTSRSPNRKKKLRINHQSYFSYGVLLNEMLSLHVKEKRLKRQLCNLGRSGPSAWGGGFSPSHTISRAALFFWGSIWPKMGKEPQAMVSFAEAKANLLHLESVTHMSVTRPISHDGRFVARWPSLYIPRRVYTS